MWRARENAGACRGEQDEEESHVGKKKDKVEKTVAMRSKSSVREEVSGTRSEKAGG